MRNGTKLRKRIQELESRHGGLRQLSRVIGVDSAYLMRLRDGEKTNPSDRVLRKLKLKRIVTVIYKDIGVKE